MKPWALGLVLMVAIVAVVGVSGAPVLRAGHVVGDLVNRPEVAHQFVDPSHGRFDAMVFLFTCVFIAPLAFLALVLVASMAHMALEATVLPMARQLGMPDHASIAVVSMFMAIVAYERADLWWPSSVKLLALITRAWVISAT